MNTKILLIISLTMSSCSHQAMYESIQQSEHRKCQKLPSSERESCARALNKSFEEYDAERRRLLKKNSD